MSVLVTIAQAGKQPSIGARTARVPSSHWLDAANTTGDTGDRGKEIPILGIQGRRHREDPEVELGVVLWRQLWIEGSR